MRLANFLKPSCLEKSSQLTVRTTPPHSHQPTIHLCQTAGAPSRHPPACRLSRAELGRPLDCAVTGMPPTCQGKSPGHAVLPGLGQSHGAWLRPGALGPGWLGGPLNPPTVNHSLRTWHWPPSRPPPHPLAPRLVQAGHPGGGGSTSKVSDSESLEKDSTPVPRVQNWALPTRAPTPQPQTGSGGGQDPHRVTSATWSPHTDPSSPVTSSPTRF